MLDSARMQAAIVYAVAADAYPDSSVASFGTFYKLKLYNHLFAEIENTVKPVAVLRQTTCNVYTERFRESFFVETFYLVLYNDNVPASADNSVEAGTDDEKGSFPREE